MKRQYLVAGFVALLGHQALGSITVSTSGPITVSQPTFVNGKAQYIVRQTAAGVAAVRFEGGAPGDAIAQVYFRPRIDGGLSIINMSFSTNSGSTTLLDSVERVTVENPANTRVAILNFNITGDVGAPGTAIDVAQLAYINAGGDMFADVIVHDRTSSGATNTGSVVLGGSWLGGGIYQNSGSLNTVTVAGDIFGPSFNPIEIWSKTSIGPISATSITTPASAPRPTASAASPPSAPSPPPAATSSPPLL